MTNDGIQVHIPKQDAEFEVLAYAVVELDAMEYSAAGKKRELVLSTGGNFEPHDDPFTFYRHDEVQTVVIPEYAPAVAYYLHGLETHGIPEDHVSEQLPENGNVDLGVYEDWLAGFTPSKRRLRLLDLADWRVETNDFAAEKYLEGEHAGTWRSTDLSESGRKLAASIRRHVPIKPRMCYWSAQRAAMKHADNHRVQYVEGLALPSQASQCTRHAWIEIDGEVAELTWPWHRYDGDDAVYFGTEYSAEEVQAARDRRDINGAIALTDDEVREVGNAMRGDQ